MVSISNPKVRPLKYDMERPPCVLCVRCVGGECLVPVEGLHMGIMLAKQRNDFVVTLVIIKDKAVLLTDSSVLIEFRQTYITQGDDLLGFPFPAKVLIDFCSTIPLRTAFLGRRDFLIIDTVDSESNST